MGEIYNAIGKADQIQTSFNFEIYLKGITEKNLQIENFKLPNGGYDFIQLCERIIKKYDFTNHAIFITNKPFSTREQGELPEQFYFHHNNSAHKYSIISTYLWDSLNPQYPLQSYILLSLALMMLLTNIKIGIHTETRGCVCDYCDNPADFLGILKKNGFCNECESFIHNQLEKKNLSVDKLISIKRLVNRALCKKICFVAIPFQDKYFQILGLIKTTLKSYEVIIGNESIMPQKINDAILLNINMCDLFIGEISESNPNVYFEIGLAQNKFCNLVLLSDNNNIPFDLKMNQIIMYDDYSKLESNLHRLDCLEF